jgi:hypothetical protein
LGKVREGKLVGCRLINLMERAPQSIVDTTARAPHTRLTMRVTMRRNANNPSSYPRDIDLESNDDKGNKASGKGSPRDAHNQKHAGGGGRRSCCKVACSLLCASLVFGLLAAAVKIKPLADSYGYEVPYFLVVPLWVRWLTERAPLIIIPATVAEGAPSDQPPVDGAEKVGDFWISRVASKPNITIVHNFLSKEDCAVGLHSCRTQLTHSLKAAWLQACKAPGLKLEIESAWGFQFNP